MNEDNQVILTEEGYQMLLDEIEQRKTVERTKIADEIELARQQGDLSENAAYSAAMKDKEFNENRIDELEKTLKNAVIRKGNSKNKKIDIGETFILEDLAAKKKTKYSLVGANEADPSKNKISINSPIGNAVIGQDYGSTIKVSLPSGEIEFRVHKE